MLTLISQNSDINIADTPLATGLPGNGDSLKLCGRVVGQVEGCMEIGEQARG